MLKGPLFLCLYALIVYLKKFWKTLTSFFIFFTRSKSPKKENE